jgi:large subunit ribosomal protein L18
MDKKQARIRRGKRARAKIRELGANRLTIHRTSQHIYAQVIAPNGQQVLASASTLDKVVKTQISGASSNITAASVVGKTIAERARQAGIEQVAFDRSGFRYHGRVKALAEAAREVGLQF